MHDTNFHIAIFQKCITPGQRANYRVGSTLKKQLAFGP